MKSGRKSKKNKLSFGQKSKVIHHLKGDIKDFKEEASEDRELIHDLKKGRYVKKKKAGRKPRKAIKALKSDIKAGKKEKKVEKVMEEFKKGDLHSGSKRGPKVKSRRQALAIALSEGRRAVKKRRK